MIENSLSGAAWGHGREGAQEGIRAEEHGEIFTVVDVLPVLLVGKLPGCAFISVFIKF
jgi:hypothetical protein